MRLELMDFWRCFVKLIPIQRPRLNFLKVWWLRNCMGRLRLLALQLVLKVSLHSLEHFASYFFADLGPEWVFFLEILGRNLFFPVCVLLHTWRHVSSFDGCLGILMDALFPFLLLLPHLLVVNEYWTWLRDRIGFKLSALAFSVNLTLGRQGSLLCHLSNVASPEVERLFVGLCDFNTLLFYLLSPPLVGLHDWVVSRLKHSVGNRFTSEHCIEFCFVLGLTPFIFEFRFLFFYAFWPCFFSGIERKWNWNCDAVFALLCSFNPLFE